MWRIGETEWDVEGVLPVSFAPLINCKEEKKELPQFIEIRKLQNIHQVVYCAESVDCMSTGCLWTSILLF